MDQSVNKLKEPLRVAVVIGKYATGGVKTVVMNYYKHMDRNSVQYDFIVYKDGQSNDYSEITDLGGQVYEVSSPKSPIRNILDMKRIFRSNGYKCVHGCINTLNVFPMLAAKKAGVQVRIAENLSTAHKGEKKTFFKCILKPLAKLYPTHLAANSIYSAEWLYGKSDLKKCKIIRNALDLNEYNYNKKIRDQMRAKLGIEDAFVVGHIGRYQYQKNHSFLIDIFNEVHKKEKNTKLILVGYGELKNEIFVKINDMGLNDAVIDVGATEDIVPYYNAMDCFVLPSFYEGLPVVGIEAQATGLPCVLSDEITKETMLTKNVSFVSLKRTAEEWADVVLSYRSLKRMSEHKTFSSKGYNIKIEANDLVNYYYSCLNEGKK